MMIKTQYGKLGSDHNLSSFPSSPKNINSQCYKKISLMNLIIIN